MTQSALIVPLQKSKSDFTAIAYKIREIGNMVDEMDKEALRVLIEKHLADSPVCQFLCWFYIIIFLDNVDVCLAVCFYGQSSQETLNFKTSIM